MISLATKMFSTSLKNNGEVALKEHGKEVYQQAVVGNPGSSYTCCDGLHLQRGASLDKHQEGYGKAERSGESPRIIPKHGNDGSKQTLADILGSSIDY